MCGIAGLWQHRPDAECGRDILERMSGALRNRGPDDAGIFYDPGAGAGLAFRRLSIIDLSPQGHQPMFSRSGRYAIVFNGEIYNFQELRAQLAGAQWRGHSDTEVMLEAIERWGLRQAVQRFVGMFAIALWDSQQRKLHLVRDRLGIKPLYYGHVDGDLVFASELKAIAQHPGFSFAIDREALALYMRYSCVPSPHCIFRGLHKLPPGSILTVSAPADIGTLETYWSAWEVAAQGTQVRFAGDEQEALAELDCLLKKAIGLRMIADVPLGAFLSGGIDSSAVVALMQAQSSRPVKTFTIGFHEDEYNEAEYAKGVARHLGTDHTELYLTPQQALEVVPLLPAMFDEPFADPSQIPTYLVSKLARQSVTVSLSGDGGDELFGGYNRYLRVRRIWDSINRVPARLGTVAAAGLSVLRPRTVNRIARRLNFFLPDWVAPHKLGERAHRYKELLSCRTPQAIYRLVMSQWPHPEQIVLDTREPGTVARSFEQAARLPTIEEMMMFADLVNYLPDDILTKLDRASMAVSLEARVPLLDHRVVEFAWSLPLPMKIRSGCSKWVLRQLLHRYVPAVLVDRPKMGFGVPIDHWLRGPLREWAEDLLSAESLRASGLDPAPIRKKWQQHRSGDYDWQYPLWNVLIFQQWAAANKCAALAQRSEEPVQVRQ